MAFARPKHSLLQGCQGTVFSKHNDHGGQGFKIGFLCMEEYTHREGCYSKECEVEGWQWGKNQNLAGSLAAKKASSLLSECPIADFEDSIVDILIDPHTRQWNVEMVEGLFHEEEAEVNKQIPLSQLASKDILYWPYSNNGMYNYKSGYKFLKMEEELMDRVHESLTDGDTWFGSKYGP